MKAAAESFSLELEPSPSQSELHRTFQSPSNILTFPNSRHVCIMPIPDVISQHLSFPVFYLMELHQEPKYHNKVMNYIGRSVATSSSQWSGTRGEKWTPYSGCFHPDVSFTWCFQFFLLPVWAAQPQNQGSFSAQINKGSSTLRRQLQPL